MMEKITLRFATPDDTAALLEIYRPYVEGTTVTLEYVTPTLTEFAERIRVYSAEFPYLVCEVDGEIAGYAYAHRYKQRYGYRFCAELTVYLSNRYTGRKLGSRLYGALIDLLDRMGYTNLYGIVTDPNPGSFALHQAFGFRETGREHRAACKYGQWFDVVLFERLCGDRPAVPPERPLTIGELDGETITRILAHAMRENFM